MILELLAVVVLLAGSAFFSGSESAMIAANPLHLAAEAERGGRGARRARSLLRDPERLFSLLLLGNNLVNVALAAVVTAMVGRWSQAWGPLASTLLLAPILLVFGEIVPKTVALLRADRMSTVVAGPLWALDRALSPLIRMLAAVARRLTARSGAGEKRTIQSREELRLLLEMGAGDAEMREEERQTAFRVIDFGEKSAQAAMLPLVDVTALPLDATLDQVAAVARRTGYSRIPIYDERIDDLVGIVHVMDLLGERDPRRTARELLHPTPYVPESQPLPELLSTLQRERREMAFVVDEYGAVVGLITIEDLVEEIVGEIEDEYDLQAPPEIEPDGSGGYLVAGRSELESFVATTGWSLPRGVRSETLAGLVIEAAGHIPPVGETVETGDLSFEILEADGRRVRRMRVRRTASEA